MEDLVQVHPEIGVPHRLYWQNGRQAAVASQARVVPLDLVGKSVADNATEY